MAGPDERTVIDALANPIDEAERAVRIMISSLLAGTVAMMAIPLAVKAYKEWKKASKK